MTSPTALLTCRYWAFGTGCPNIHDGKNICTFAHWDTGMLAPAFEQRGTCKKWTNGNCERGNSCYYEHRVTGIEGLYQGRPDLKGFNHEVKVAAEKAGFDIWNHDGLYNLIWAVKRVALRASKNANIDQKPPKDPVYPDRFRPSGFRDNTKRKRPDQPPPPVATTPVTLNPTVQVPQGERRKFRYKNKKPAPQIKPVVAAFDFDKQGTLEHPINLVYDDKEDGPSPVAKRQRMEFSVPQNNRQVANTSYPRAAADMSSQQSLGTAMGVRTSDQLARDTMQIDGHTYLRTNARVSNHFTAGNDYDRAQSRVLKNHLTKVENALEGTSNHMTWCNRSMSTLFVNHSEVLAGPSIHPLLEKLNKNIEDTKASSLQGAEILKDVLYLVP